MATTIDELTITQYENGTEVVKQLDKKVLSQGAWSTVVFKYQDWDAKKEAYSPIRFTIRRYQKKNSVYNQRSKFNISSIDQAQKLIAVLQDWSEQETVAVND
jgi:hypothetical protein